MNTLEIISQSQSCLEITDSNQCALEISSPSITLEVSFAIVGPKGEKGDPGGGGITEAQARQIADEQIEVQAVNAGSVPNYGALVAILTNT